MHDAGCIRVLRNCRGAMADGGRVLIVQQLMPAPGTNADTLFEAALSDLNMLVLLGGHDRTELEYRRLLAAAGLEWTRTIPTPSLMSIVEAVRA